MDRYTHSWNHHLWKNENGEYVLYEDHLAVVAEKDREIERLQTNIDVMKRALRWSECEEDWDG